MQTIPWWRRFDPLLVVVPILLVIYGLALIHSATCKPDCARWLPPSSWAVKQAIFALAGFVLMALVALMDYRLSRTLAYWAYAGSLGLLVLVHFVGHGSAEYGATRWIALGPFDLQPSELAKLALVLALARFLSASEGSLSWLRLGGSLLVLAPSVILVFSQPDLGTAVSLLAIWFAVVAGAGLRGRQFGALLGTSLVVTPLAWFVLKDYMRDRILIFVRTIIDPESDIFGEGYNILQARISIGSGGLLGRGLTKGTQTQLDYLRVKHSDFIFSVLAEELGFIGGALLFILFVFLLFRILRVADRSKDQFGRLVAFGIAAWLLFQVFVNLGSNLTLLPVTGLPLPFLSVGGSSLVTMLVAFGLLQSVLLRRMKYRY
jgi:rod shape determining protein RodA